MESSIINMDIVYRIIYWCAKDAGESCKRWKDALPLLSVCSSWRQAGLKQLYSTMFIRDKRIGNQKYFPNYSLIMDNGYGSLVKRLVDTDDCWAGATASVIKIVGATESNCPGVGKFMEGRPGLCSFDEEEQEEHEDGYIFCLCTSYEIHRDYTLANVECPNQVYHDDVGSIQPRLAEMLKEKLPNITTFNIRLESMTYPFVNIYLDILKVYEGQITELVYEGPELGIELESPNLRTLGYKNNTYYENYDLFKCSQESIRRVKGYDWEDVYDHVLDNYDGIEAVHMSGQTAEQFYQAHSLDDISKVFSNIKFAAFKDVSYAFDGGSWHEV